MNEKRTPFNVAGMTEPVFEMNKMHPKKKKPKFRVKRRFFLFVGLIVYVSFSFGQQYYAMHQMDQEIAGYAQIKNELLQEQKGLEAEMALLENRSHIERIAREDLGLIKPGEILLVPGEPGKLPEVKSIKELSNNIH
ncbi:FtsB family cell division protein [Dehalobacterium formicoaceticum]|uniref:Septum formation initiator family protein n=1 Tax=Dehalobacterium formicoaceticum TaxID=51515 RepID=A0ABT1Y377_9FIRM|nr:septum formation initiator family protein [Dehalobacterium formicoaceticum]MCR6545329.1 septum formation initiator family protein [Dehalobacterium formicoaceticum]